MVNFTLTGNLELKKNSIKEILIFGVFRPAIYVLYVTCHIIILYNGFHMVLAGKLLSKDLVKFYQYNGQFFNPIQQLAEQFNQLQSAFASSERIFEILDMQEHILDSDDAIELSEIKGKIEFDHVWFAYNDENWILKDVSFTILPGQTVAFVGATGAGKTFTTCNFTYRLIRHAKAKRILFLVDRNNLGEQTKDEYKKFKPKGENNLFTDLYIVQHLQQNKIDKDAKVVITTIQCFAEKKIIMKRMKKIQLLNIIHQ